MFSFCYFVIKVSILKKYKTIKKVIEIKCMVKENLIIENKKPFEIVQEVNNEVPSFEEFMKTYEGGVNYDEFNYCGDIGMSKKYGPGED